ncbi:hypothetical protein COHA_006920 [Chlorella ohadii]|uniref:BZIP domain-containing protein n=1 Tax=Chlorella ohadii TaxID=2649997 RepID=A0AAD5H0E1_9CHLO|nr:hypothetical protein COHA_006920 [Chlorella ohadii]
MGAFGLPGGEEGTKTEGQEEGEDETEDEEEEAEDSDSDGRPKRKRSARRKKGDVKSQSSAALAMLAGAASKPTSAAAAAAAAAMQQNLGELWGSLNGAGGLPAGASGIDLSKLSTEQQQQLLANPEYAGISDEREVKRLRRKQSNRESARRSRLRKQAETEQLARQVKDLATENARLKEEKMQLVAQIEILNAKLSMSAFGAMHGLAGEAPKLAAQGQDMQSVQMAAAMAQAMQVNPGAMLGAGLGIPALDAKPLDGTDPEAVAAAAAAAAAVAATGVDPTGVQAAQGVEAA